LAKIFGCTFGKIYSFDENAIMEFEKKMFLGIARTLNVVSYQAK
jgi:hypothetical protein